MREPIYHARRVVVPVYWWIRRLPERFGHRRRHRNQLGQLVQGARPRNILVLCHGNVCRSPYLEATLRAKLPTITVESAGFVGPGRSVPAHAVDVASSHGVDLSAHRSRLVTPEMVRRAQLVLVMDARQLDAVVLQLRGVAERVVVVGDLDPVPLSVRTILDPWNKPRSAFERSYARLERCADTLVRCLVRRED
jgi:protein-tyrosine phosphatase